MPNNQFKRHVAYKFRVGNLLTGKPIIDNEKFSFLELGGKKIVRINIIGNIVDKYESKVNKRYTFLTLDDGSGQIKIKSFGDDSVKFEDASQGQTVVVIGTLRFFNNEIYVSPEILKEYDPKYLLIRKLELEKSRFQNHSIVEKEQITATKDKILDEIKNSESDGGIELNKIIEKFNVSVSKDIINNEIQKLLEEGIIFEPRPGKLRWLG